MKTIGIREAGMLEWIYYVQPEDLSLILSSQEGLRAPSYLEGDRKYASTGYTSFFRKLSDPALSDDD